MPCVESQHDRFRLYLVNPIAFCALPVVICVLTIVTCVLNESPHFEFGGSANNNVQTTELSLQEKLAPALAAQARQYSNPIQCLQRLCRNLREIL